MKRTPPRTAGEASLHRQAVCNGAPCLLISYFFRLSDYRIQVNHTKLNQSMKTLLYLLPLVLILAGSCKKNEDTTPVPAQNSTDNAIRLPSDGWFYFVGPVPNNPNLNNYQSVSTVPASATDSPSFSLAATTIKDTASFCAWSNNFTPAAGLKTGSLITLKAKIRLENVQGPGVSLVLRGDTRVQSNVLFETTQNQVPIRGTADFADYSVTLSYATPVDIAAVYLVLLPKTTGKVIFRDVTVTVSN